MAELVRGSEAEEEEQRRDIRVRDAGTYLQLLNLPLDGGDDAAAILGIFRGVPNRAALKKIADVCNLVMLLQGSLLPSLRRVPADAAHLLVVDACAQKIREHARAVGGGSFSVSCKEFVQRIDSYAADARGHPGNGTDVVSLRGSVDDLLGQASRFLDMSCTPDEAEADAEA